MRVEINNKENINKRHALLSGTSSVPLGSLSKTSAPLLKYMKKGKNVNKDSSSLLRFNPNAEYDIFAPELLKEDVNIAKEKILEGLNILKAIPTDFDPETKITTPENFKITLRKRTGLEGNVITIEKKEYDKLALMFSDYYRARPLHSESFFYPENPETRKRVIDVAKEISHDPNRKSLDLMGKYNNHLKLESDLYITKAGRMWKHLAVMDNATSAVCADNWIVVAGTTGVVTKKNIYATNDSVCYKLPNTYRTKQIECKKGLLCFLNDGKLFIFKDNLLTSESGNSGLVSNFVTKIELPEGQKIKCFDLSYGDSSKLFLATSDGKIFFYDLSIEDDLSTLGKLEGEKIYKFSNGMMFKKFEETGVKGLVSLIDGCTLVVSETGKVSVLYSKEGYEAHKTLRRKNDERIKKISNGFLLPLKNEVIFSTLSKENKIKIFSFNYKENTLHEKLSFNIKDIESNEKILRLEVDNWHVRIYSVVDGAFVERKISKHIGSGGKVCLVK